MDSDWLDNGPINNRDTERFRVQKRIQDWFRGTDSMVANFKWILNGRTRDQTSKTRNVLLNLLEPNLDIGPEDGESLNSLTCAKLCDGSGVQTQLSPT